MGIMDTVFWIVILIFTFLGIYKGFVKQVFSIAAWILAIILPLLLTSTISKFLYSIFKQEIFANNTAVFIGLFVISFIVIKIIGHFMKKGVQKSGFGFVDRFFGAIWGFTKAMLIISFVLLIVKALTTAPLVGEEVLAFIQKDLHLDSDTFGLGRYIYMNNPLPKLISLLT